MNLFQSADMTGRDDRIYQEALGLWRQVFGDRPPPPADGTTLIALVMTSIPEAGYDRLRTPHLRTTNITMPKQA